MSAINRFLLNHGLSIASNPCVSPDFCLDWPRLHAALSSGQAREHSLARISLPGAQLSLWEDGQGDHAWVITPAGSAQPQAETPLQGGRPLVHGAMAYPATWTNLLRIKNLLQEADPQSTVFPTSSAKLGQSTLGVGARFTTLHWPAVEWAMATLGIGMTANQNSIPRELVYDVDEMLANRLDTVPFPFIGANVPEGHQGQSVEGMSHGCVLSKLKTGFHRRRIAWSFNADHQPIGGKFDVREDRLVSGCLLASYITFDLSPELAQTQIPAPEARAAWVAANVPAALVSQVRARCSEAGVTLDGPAVDELLCRVWPAVRKMKVRDEKYAAIRAKHFSTPIGRDYLRELSIDELPGLTTPATTAVMLSLCEALGMRIHFIAPAFGFQKNMPYPDNNALRGLIEAQWGVCKHFDVSIGFHSGSGKSAENYQVMGQVTGSRLEIKTSGRYTYEMGRALFASQNPADQALWKDWYRFTVDMAVAGAFSADPTEQKMARSFVVESLKTAGKSGEPFASPADCRAALEALPPSTEYMTFFEYNFLFVLAANGKADKAALGDHTAAGYTQRARFYAISDEGRLRFAKNIAAYLIFLAENTGLSSAARCSEARRRLEAAATYQDFLAGIASS